MTEYELNAFRSEFDPVTLAEKLKEDPSPAGRAKQFAILQTAFFLTLGGEKGGLAVLNNKQGESVLPAFTCREELDKWPFARGEIKEVPFSALRKLVEQDDRLAGIVVDPFGRSLRLDRSHFGDMDRTLRAASPRKALKMKATRDYPIGLPMAVEALMQQHPEVYRVWLLAAHFEGEHTDRKLFIVDFDGKPEELFPHLAEAVKLYLRQGEGVEMMKANISLLRAAEQAAKPIYVKG